MPETETRMSRYHGKDKHRREYEDYVKGGASQESKQADWPALEDQDQDLGQTQVYSSKNWQEDPYAYHEVEEIPEASHYQDYSAYEDSSYGTETYQDEGYDYDEHQAYVAYDEYEEYEEEPALASKPTKVKGPYSLRLDRFLNNALILVAVLLLIVMVIMFVF